MDIDKGPLFLTDEEDAAVRALPILAARRDEAWRDWQVTMTAIAGHPVIHAYAVEAVVEPGLWRESRA